MDLGFLFFDEPKSTRESRCLETFPPLLSRRCQCSTPCVATGLIRPEVGRPSTGRPIMAIGRWCCGSSRPGPTSRPRTSLVGEPGKGGLWCRRRGAKPHRCRLLNKSPDMVSSGRNVSKLLRATALVRKRTSDTTNSLKVTSFEAAPKPQN